MLPSKGRPVKHLVLDVDDMTPSRTAPATGQTVAFF